MNASIHDRQIQIRRAVGGDDGYGNVVIGWANQGGLIWALRQDVKDVEKVQSGAVMATITSRFQVRNTPFTRGITPADALNCDGQVYNITGRKEASQYGRRQLLEFTAEARADGP